MSDTPSRDVSDPMEAVSELVPSCAVTRAMAKANAGKDDKPGDVDIRRIYRRITGFHFSIC